MREFSETDAASPTLERRIMELTVFHEVSRALQKTVEESKALNIILVGVTAGRGLGFNRAFILLPDEEGKTLVGRMGVGPADVQEAQEIWSRLETANESLRGMLDSLRTADIDPKSSINRLAARLQAPLAETGHPLIQILKSHEAARAAGGMFLPHALPVPPQLPELLGTEEFAVAPLYHAGKDLGLLIADNAVMRAPIDLPDLQLLEIYAQEASASIENTRLYRRLLEEIRLSEERNVLLLKSQKQLLGVERLSAMGRVATLLAFRMRAPLASIGGFTRRLLGTMPPEDPRLEEMNIIVADVARLERLVAEVLAYRRISRPVFRPTDVNILIQSVLATMQDEIRHSRIQIHPNLDPGLPVVPVDPIQLRQALMNLVTNALEAMPSGGELTLATTFDTEWIEIEVRDTGVGIPRHNWNKLFKPFFTTKTTGTGLGLAIVSQVAESHGGSIRFESVIESGTTFHLRLSPRPPVGPAAREGAAAADSGKK